MRKLLLSLAISGLILCPVPARAATGSYTYTLTLSPANAATVEIIVFQLTGITNGSLQPFIQTNTTMGTATTSVPANGPDDPFLLLKAGENPLGNIATTDMDITMLETSDTLSSGYLLVMNPSAGESTTWTGINDMSGNYGQTAMIMALQGASPAVADSAIGGGVGTAFATLPSVNTGDTLAFYYSVKFDGPPVAETITITDNYGNMYNEGTFGSGNNYHNVGGRVTTYDAMPPGNTVKHAAQSY